MVMLVPVASLLILIIVPVTLFPSANAYEGPQIILRSSFVDSEGRTNVVGTVRNFGPAAAEVTVGLKTNDGTEHMTPTHGRIIWPLTDSPFKFVLEKGTEQAGETFIAETIETSDIQYDVLVLTYDNMAVGEERAFVGKIRNTGAFEFHNVSVFAAVHSPDHKFQLDTVRSNVIATIRPGEEAEFIAVPDPMIKSDVLYYSCAGLDFNAPITTVETADGKFIPFSMTALAEVSRVRHDNATDSMIFSIRHYLPDGGPLNVKIPQLAQDHTVAVSIDGNLEEQAAIRGDGKTLSIDISLPKGEHEVSIQGVRNIPEFPLAFVALAALTSLAVIATKLKAAFKVP
ncbi:MAG TPA: hypothetical protein VIB07_00620 [Nitrososphaera sp.]|jgi:hypothetical protein